VEKDFTIIAHNVSKSFTKEGQKLFVLRGISASFHQGGRYALTGVSGVGKSTLLHILAGLDTPSGGNVFYNGVESSFVCAAERAEQVGIIFQYPYLIKELSVLENVVLMGLIRGISLAESKERAQELLALVGLSDKLKSAVKELSGGQQQRVSLTRALMQRPRFLLADEPTGSLDEATGRQMLDLLLYVHEQWQMGLIICSHNAQVVAAMETVFTLKEGELVEREHMVGVQGAPEAHERRL